MELSRRNFLKASLAIGAALELGRRGLFNTDNVLGAENGLPVVWLQGQACTGCSVSLLNSVYYDTIDHLLTSTLDLNYHSTVMAGAGDAAVAAAEATRAAKGYVLVIEGAVPAGGKGVYCHVWPDKTMLQAVKDYAANATYIVAVGTCASFGGVAAAHPNPTGARSVKKAIGSKLAKKLVCLPGCPCHPDWIVGTIAYILQNGAVPPMDKYKRPTAYYGAKVHESCPNLPSYVGPSHHSKGRPCTTCHGSNMGHNIAGQLGDTGCLYGLGCKGPKAGCDAATRKWNSGAAATAGVSWCVTAGSPCIGCTEPKFPDGMDPFFKG